MEPRMDYAKIIPDAIKAMYGLEQYVNQSLVPSLLDLVKTRASQINGCAYCLDMHTKDARARGKQNSASTRSLPARDTVFHRTRAGRFDVDGNSHARSRDSHSRRSLRVGSQTLRRKRIGESRLGDYGDQWLEPARHRISQSARHLPARWPLEDVLNF